MVSIIAVLLVSNVSVWSSVYALEKDNTLRVYFFDVGQGDAIFIESPTGERVLIDGGPDRKVLSRLGEVLPLGDRRIDVVFATHPDSDHIIGLVEVVRRFDVDVFIDPGISSSNEVDDILYKELEEKNVQRILARQGLTLSLGSEVSLQIMFPRSDVLGLETNEASIVSKLVYGEKSFLLTGDATKRTEYLLLNSNEELLDVDVLQVGHHGSDTSTSPWFVEVTSPEVAVISAGRKNRYGHPHQNVLNTLEKFGVETLGTYALGTILIETDGSALRIK